MPVRILEEHVVNQIAAGEVVERPASVVRELFQNSLDAGATRIRVTLKGGGSARILVADDGIGMSRADAMMCLERHATSKIRSADDLATVGTLGFRGEALPSIAAVSRFELRTRPAESDAGTRLRVEGGTLRSVGEVGCAPGTEVEVGGLFYNLPARRAFLRTKATELTHCVAVVQREALMRPEIDIRLNHEGRELVLAPQAAQLEDRVAAVLGDVARSLVSVDVAVDSVRVRGVLSPVGVHRATAASAVFLYVNGRYVRDPLLRRAVYDAYRGRVPRGRYPVVVLDVQMPAVQVDVNVHPTKVEVRFHRPRAVTEAVVEAVRGQLDSAPQRLAPSGPMSSSGPGPLFDADARGPRPVSPAVSVAPGSRPPSAHPDDDPRVARTMLGPREPSTPVGLVEPPQRDGVDGFGQLTVLGLVRTGLLVCLRDDQLWVLDVPEARAALWVLRHQQGQAEVLGRSQRLLAPVRLEVPRDAADLLEAQGAVLAELGLDVDRFGPRELAVRGVPVGLQGAPMEALIVAAAEALSSGNTPTEALLRSASALTPAPDDPRAQRTLLAELDEVGLAVEPPFAVRVPPETLRGWMGRAP